MNHSRDMENDLTVIKIIKDPTRYSVAHIVHYKNVLWSFEVKKKGTFVLKNHPWAQGQATSINKGLYETWLDVSDNKLDDRHYIDLIYAESRTLELEESISKIKSAMVKEFGQIYS